MPRTFMYVKYIKVDNQELHAELFKQKARDGMEMEYRLIEDEASKGNWKVKRFKLNSGFTLKM